MLNEENLKTTGKLNITVTDGNGDVKDQIEINNLVVTTGRNYIADRIINSPALMSHMAVGLGTTTQDYPDTTLESEAYRVSFDSTGRVNNTATMVGVFLQELSGPAIRAITEAGIFNSSTGGTMLCRTVFPVINLQPADSMSIEWIITVS